jgi:hypothetical protein
MQAAATQAYTVDLPAGAYEISMTIASSITGTTTTISGIRPCADKSQTIVLPSRNDFTCITPDSGVVSTKTITFVAGNTGSKYAQIIPSSITGPPMGTQIPYGFRFLVTKGTAVTGERFDVTVVASKIA